MPAFGHTQNFVASPDGRHAYLSTEDEGLLLFERIGVGADAYTQLEILSVSPGEVRFGPISAGGPSGAFPITGIPRADNHPRHGTECTLLRLRIWSRR